MAQQPLTPLTDYVSLERRATATYMSTDNKLLSAWISMGYEASEHGASIDCNPFPEQTDAYNCWCTGWYEADADYRESLDDNHSILDLLIGLAVLLLTVGIAAWLLYIYVVS